MSQEILAYIDSLKPSYPAGVGYAAAAAKAKIPFKLLLVARSEKQRAPQVSEMLNNIITKGLRLKLSDARIVLDGAASQEAQATANKIVYFSGETASANFGKVMRQDGRLVLHTHLVESALDSVETKREIWTHLKQIL